MKSSGYGLDTAPADIRRQVDSFMSATAALLADNLRGIYLHGSLAQGSFQPERSDIDLLVLTQHSLSQEAKQRFAQILLSVSGTPRPLEMSLLYTAQFTPWRYPAPYDFHFSEDWRERMAKDLAAGTYGGWAGGTTDTDLAAHFTVAKSRGVTLHGEPIASILPDIPPADFAAAILEDLEWLLEQGEESILYATLNACRIAAFFDGGHLFSKAEGAEWALATFPAQHHRAIRAALAAYLGRPGPNLVPADGMALVRFAGSRVDAIRNR